MRERRCSTGDGKDGVGTIGYEVSLHLATQAAEEPYFQTWLVGVWN